MSLVPTQEESEVLSILDDDTQLETIDASTAIEAQTRGEIDIQIATARRYPRRIAQVLRDTKDLVTVNEETASSCFYRLPRGGKILEGPSIRMAEIMASTWGHMRCDTKIVEQDGRFIKVKAVAWDLQSNVAIAQEVTRRITDKNGKTFSDDMIAVTANAAMSIAIRNAILRVIPRTYINALVFLAKQVAVGDLTTLNQRRGQALDYFAKLGIPNERVFKTLGVTGVEEIGLEHLATLTGLRTGIKEKTITPDEAFPVDAPATPVARGAAALADRLAKKGETPAPTEAPKPADPPPSSPDDAAAFLASTGQTPAPEPVKAEPKGKREPAIKNREDGLDF